MTASSLTVSDRTYFTIEFLGDKIAFKATNGKYVVTKKNGALAATGTSASADAVYIWEIINRPSLILRGEQGFVGLLPSGVLECNKSTPEVFQMHITKGVAYISGQNGKYWKVNDDNISVTGTEPTPFFLELTDLSKLVLKYKGNYIQGFQNGGFDLHAIGKPVRYHAHHVFTFSASARLAPRLTALHSGSTKDTSVHDGSNHIDK